MTNYNNVDCCLQKVLSPLLLVLYKQYVTFHCSYVCVTGLWPEG